MSRRKSKLIRGNTYRYKDIIEAKVSMVKFVSEEMLTQKGIRRKLFIARCKKCGRRYWETRSVFYGFNHTGYCREHHKERYGTNKPSWLKDFSKEDEIRLRNYYEAQGVTVRNINDQQNETKTLEEVSQEGEG